MSGNMFLEKLRGGEILLGVFNMYPAAGIVEGMCRGWDYVWVDNQHGQMDYNTSAHSLRSAGVIGINTVLRVPTHQHGLLGWYADLAPDGIVVPMVDSAEQAQEVVRGLHFPPLGNRSFGGRRVIDLGGRMYWCERKQAVIAQIETVEGLANVDDIAQTEGVDGLFVGPDDMRLQLGIDVNLPTLDHPDLLKAIDRTAEAARNAGKFCGIVAADERTLSHVLDRGYQMIISGADIAFLRVASAAKLEDMRAVLEGRSGGEKDSGSTGSAY